MWCLARVAPAYSAANGTPAPQQGQVPDGCCRWVTARKLAYSQRNTQHQGEGCCSSHQST
jgi:hypothetical protein